MKSMYSNTSELKQKLVSKVFRRSWIAALASSSTSKVQTLNAQNFFANCKSSQINGLFGSLEKEERGGKQREMISLYLVWMFLKLVRGKGVISSSSYLDVLKIRRERRGNNLNRQIYPYLKIDLQHWSMINLLD